NKDSLGWQYRRDEFLAVQRLLPDPFILDDVDLADELPRYCTALDSILDRQLAGERVCADQNFDLIRALLAVPACGASGHVKCFEGAVDLVRQLAGLVRATVGETRPCCGPGATAGRAALGRCGEGGAPAASWIGLASTALPRLVSTMMAIRARGISVLQACGVREVETFLERFAGHGPPTTALDIMCERCL
ncbi:hypothetical protein CYMTET_56817, partial [Cymbomonas tetramitiformis]